MVRAAEIRHLAHQQLKGHWTGPVIFTLLLCLFTLGVELLLSLLDGDRSGEAAGRSLSFIFDLFVAPALAFSTIVYFLKFKREEKVDNSMIFYGFNNQFFKVVWANILISLRMLAWMIIPVLVFAIASAVLVFMNLQSSTNTTYVAIISGLVLIAVMIPMIQIPYKYSMTMYILHDQPDLSASQALQASADLMNGYKWKLFCLQLSFIGWQLLVIFTLLIGYLWLSPYMMLSNAHFYELVCAEQKKLLGKQS